MWYAPIRIKRESSKVELSKLHWVETLQYHIIYAAEKDFLTAQNKNDIKNFMESNIKRYEQETCGLRRKAFDEEPKGIS